MNLFDTRREAEHGAQLNADQNDRERIPDQANRTMLEDFDEQERHGMSDLQDPSEQDLEQI